MEGGFPKKDEFSTKGKQGNAFFSPNLLACVSVSFLNFLSHVTIFITLTCLEMVSSAPILSHLKTCSFSTNLLQKC